MLLNQLNFFLKNAVYTLPNTVSTWYVSLNVGHWSVKANKPAGFIRLPFIRRNPHKPTTILFTAAPSKQTVFPWQLMLASAYMSFSLSLSLSVHDQLTHCSLSTVVHAATWRLSWNVLAAYNTVNYNCFTHKKSHRLVSEASQIFFLWIMTMGAPEEEGWREDNHVLMSPPSHSLLSPRTREIWAEIKLLISNRSAAEGKVAVQGCIWCKHKTYARQCLIQTHLNAGYILFQFRCKTQLWKKCDTEKWKKKPSSRKV